MRRWLAAMINVVMATIPGVVVAGDARGTLGLEGHWFPGSPMFVDRAGTDQSDASWRFSGFTTLEWSGDLGEWSAFAVNLFGRATSDADDALFGDAREAVLIFDLGGAEVEAGVISETWGVLEAWNPVDIVNQRDMAEDFQGEAKLGQPGVSATVYGNDLVFSLFALTYSREQRIAEGRDRLRILPEPVRSETFENGQDAPNLAARVQYRDGDLDLSLSHFHGHSRDPLYSPLINMNGVLTGFHADYLRISQTALEAQYVVGDGIFKGELIYQDGASDTLIGGGIGFERVFYRFVGEGDLSVYIELYHDNRGTDLPLTPFQEDLYLGARFSLNDTNDTQFEGRFTHDLEWDSTLVDLRAQRRLSGNFILDARLVIPSNVRNDPALQGFENDEYLDMGVTWYY